MATILVTLLGNAKQLKAELAGAQAATAKANTGFAKMQKAAGVAGLALAGGLAFGLVKSVQAADEMQQSTARMNTAFAAVHVPVKAFAGAIEDAEGKSRKLGFSNESVKDSLGSLIVATHNGGKALKDLSIAQDIARFKHISLEGATKILTMAMAGSQRAVKQLGINVPKVTSNFDAYKATVGKTISPTEKLQLAHAKLVDKMATSNKVIDTVKEKLHGQAKAFADTAAGGMAKFHAQLGDVAEKLGVALLPALKTLADKLAAGAAFLSTHTTLTKGLVIAVAALAAVLITVSVATTLVSAAIAIWTGVTGLATAAQWLWNAAMLANPIGLVIVGIAALIAAGVLLYKNSATVRAIVQGAFAGIKSAGEAAFGFLTNTVFPAFQNAWNKSGGVVGAVVGAIKGYISGLKAEIQGVINFVGDLIHGRWSKLWGDAVQIVSGILQQLKAIFLSLPKAILTHLGDIAGAAKTIGEAILNGIVGAIKGLPGALSSVVSAGFNALKSLIESFHVSVKTETYLGVPVPVGMSIGFGGGGGVSAPAGGLTGPIGAVQPVRAPKVSGRGAGAVTVPATLRGDGDAGAGAASKALDALKKKLQAVADAAEKVRAAVQAKMDTAFEHIKDFALKAFDGATQAGLKKLQDHAAAVSAKIASDLNDKLAKLNEANAAATASEAALAALQEQHAQAGLTDAATSAAADLVAARAGGDPAAIAAAQKAVDDAAYNQRIADLTVAAAAERAAANAQLALDTKAAQDAAAVKQAAADAQAAKDVLNFNASREIKKIALQTQLDDLQAKLDEHPKMWAKTHKQIMKMFDKDFGPDFKMAGVNIGSAYIEGLKQAFKDVDPIASAAATATGNANKAAGKVPKMAMGGIVKASPGGTHVILGEGGRDELVTPLGGGVGGNTFIVNNTSNMDPRAVARAWVWQAKHVVA